MSVFDKMAHKYDSDKQVALSKIINEKIETYLDSISDKRVLDYGCGTGLIGLNLASKSKSLLLIDPSEAMINVTNKKISDMKLENSEARVGTIETLDLGKEEVDVIVVSLVMLHVKETEALLQGLYDGLKAGGQLIIIDFDKNEQIQDERVHNGFDHKELLSLVESIGFKESTVENFYKGEKLFMKQDATMFIFQGWKK